ncbi:MAG: Trimethylamine corrinoid protein [Candidatus Bathyarchaeota archaeon BA1]|nr:MAG: Trimethylamine corrinoid protein [Candidatus Bathyarchaeota archaeon BA1]
MVTEEILERKIEEHLKSIFKYFLGFKFFETKGEIKQALEAGVPSNEIIRTLLRAFHEAVEKYEKGEYCIAHLTASSSIFETGYNLVRSEIKPKGKVIIGTLGSSHYLGKDIVRLLLVADGFEVVDLGEIVFLKML